MPVLRADEDINESDMINESERDTATPANDADHLVRLESDGKIHPFFTKNGFVPNAGETINGATLPVPVYQDKTDNEVYACDANVNTKYKYIGFAISNSTDGNAIRVQTNGIVPGFTGLAEGEKYYVQDAVGTIGTSPGTMEILVGVAISETELLIQKGRRHTSGNHTFSSTTTQAVTLGFRPSIVRVMAVRATTANGGNVHSFGSWSVDGGQRCVRATNDDAAGAIASNDTSNAWNTNSSTGSDGASGTITSVTDTGFTLSNTHVGDSTVLYWEAEGEL